MDIFVIAMSIIVFFGGCVLVLWGIEDRQRALDKKINDAVKQALKD